MVLSPLTLAYKQDVSGLTKKLDSLKLVNLHFDDDADKSPPTAYIATIGKGFPMSSERWVPSRNTM